ncbi:MAG TPA: hypothetical protein VK886_17300 [Vicinamibacterales bacterium]|nr:hypothetical protein [Vicinamibacterales bacterium]
MRRLFAGSVVAVMLASVVACLPVTPSAVVTKKCAGALYCQSYSVPQNVSGGTCCVSEAGANQSVGYLCAYGADRQPAGCASSVERARYFCPTAISIVRCVAE